MQRDRPPIRVTLGEVVALEHPRHGMPAGDLDEPRGGHRAEPAGIEIHAGTLGVEDLEHLALIGPGVRLHLFGSERRAGGIAPAGIANEAREIPR